MITLNSKEIFNISRGDVAIVNLFPEWESIKGKHAIIDGVIVHIIDVERSPQRQPSFGKPLTPEEWENRDVALLCHAIDPPV